MAVNIIVRQRQASPNQTEDWMIRSAEIRYQSRMPVLNLVGRMKRMRMGMKIPVREGV